MFMILFFILAGFFIYKAVQNKDIYDSLNANAYSNYYNEIPAHFVRFQNNNSTRFFRNYERAIFTYKINNDEFTRVEYYNLSENHNNAYSNERTITLYQDRYSHEIIGSLNTFKCKFKDCLTLGIVFSLLAIFIFFVKYIA